VKAKFPVILGLIVLAVAAITMAAPSRASAQVPWYGNGYGFGLGYGGYGYGLGGYGLGYGNYGYRLGYGGYGYGLGGYGLGYGNYGYGLGLGYGTYAYPSVYSYASSYVPSFGLSVAGGLPYNVEVPGVNFSPAGSDATPDSCWAFDSWCSYCTANPGSDLCKAMPPSPMQGTH